MEDLIAVKKRLTTTTREYKCFSYSEAKTLSEETKMTHPNEDRDYFDYLSMDGSDAI